MQDVLVALIVTGCTLYATWVLMPAAWRRALAGLASGLPLPQALRLRLEIIARRAPGCGCDGCDAPVPKPPGQAQPVRFVRKPHA